MTHPRGQERESGSPATLCKHFCAWPRSRTPACCADVASLARHLNCKGDIRSPMKAFLGLRKFSLTVQIDCSKYEGSDIKRRQEAKEMKMCNVSFFKITCSRSHELANLRHSPPHGRPVLADDRFGWEHSQSHTA